MPPIPAHTVDIHDLGPPAQAIVEKVRASREPAVITSEGQATAVLLSAEKYEEAERKRQILEMLIRAKEEIREGAEYDLDEVMADLRRT